MTFSSSRYCPVASVTTAGRARPVGLQVEPAVDHPAQDRRVFDDELFLQLLVALGRLEPERHQVEAAGQRVVDGGNARLGIADEYQFEARPEFEKALVHVAGGDAALVAGELLDLADRPGAVFLRLAGDHQPGVGQARQLAQVGLVL